MRARTSASQARGSMSFILAVTIRLYITAGALSTPVGPREQPFQDYLGHRDPKHTVHYTRVAGNRFPRPIWRLVTRLLTRLLLVWTAPDGIDVPE
jgi:hypothetical protein